MSFLLKILILKIQHIILAALIIIMIPIIYFSYNKAISVFSSSDREIPIYSVERNDNKISLTFDCAWNDSDIDSILTTLDKYNIKASFFVTGTWAEKYPESIKKIFDKGHDLGNHSYNHADYTKLSSTEILNDMEKCDNIVEEITGYKMVLMRAPSGGYNNNVVKTANDSGKKYIQWSIDGLDYTSDATESSILKRINKTEAGDIILMHNGTKLTSSVLPTIIEALSEKYEFVKVSELIYEDNYTIDHTGKQIPK